MSRPWRVFCNIFFSSFLQWFYKYKWIVKKVPFLASIQLFQCAFVKRLNPASNCQESHARVIRVNFVKKLTILFYKEKKKNRQKEILHLKIICYSCNWMRVSSSIRQRYGCLDHTTKVALYSFSYKRIFFFFF